MVFLSFEEFGILFRSRSVVLIGKLVPKRRGVGVTSVAGFPWTH
jgi:hypothetical protein